MKNQKKNIDPQKREETKAINQIQKKKSLKNTYGQFIKNV